MSRLVQTALALAFGLAGLTGCTPSIGDKCVLSTDCSLRGDRTCDTSQPGGYCTIRDCRGNTCPDDGACVLYEPTVPGCGFDDQAPSRVGRGYCMARCENDGDCRSGYVCADPKAAPWFAVVLDDDLSKRVCIWPASVASTATATASAATPPPVCGSVAPDAGPIVAHSAYSPDSGTGGGGGGGGGGRRNDAGASDASADADDAGAGDGG